jgi:hypothetical protein
LTNPIVLFYTVTTWLIVVAAVVGVASASILRSKNPELYARMGRHRGDG